MLVNLNINPKPQWNISLIPKTESNQHSNVQNNYPQPFEYNLNFKKARKTNKISNKK
jgi:hypothetical protein